MGWARHWKTTQLRQRKSVPRQTKKERTLPCIEIQIGALGALRPDKTKALTDMTDMTDMLWWEGVGVGGQVVLAQPPPVGQTA